MSRLLSKDKQSTYQIMFLVAGLGAALLLMRPFITAPMMAASASYFSMIVGLQFRKISPKMHGVLMSSAILIDLILVLIMEFQRHAIKTVAAFTLTVPQQIHVFSSTVAVVLYIPVLILGVKILLNKQKRNQLIRPHTRVAIAAFLFRTIGFVFMFSLLNKVSGS